MTSIRGSGGGGGGRAPREDKDSLRSLQVAELVMLISEGEAKGLVNGLKSVYLDGVPIETSTGARNFEDVDFAYVPGTQGQPALAGLTAVQTEIAVGVQVDQGAPVVRTITSTLVDHVRVTIGVPALTEAAANGDLKGSEFEWAIDVQSAGGGWVERHRSKVQGKTTSRYARAVRVPLIGMSGPPFDIRVRRISPDPASASITNRFVWDAYTEITSVKLRYPNSAVAKLRFNAQQFSRPPLVAFDWLGQVVKVPINYDPIARTYSGVWNGTFKLAWTNNPAWILYDLITHPRYGLGGYVPATLANKWKLYTIGQYCDQQVPDGRGGTEPRFTCNLVLQTREEAYRVLLALAGVFRGMVYWSGSAVDFAQDAPSDAKPLFTPANVVDGQFTYSDVSERTKHSMCVVYWNDRGQMGKRVPEVHVDEALVARYGVRELELQPIGCASRGMAARVARWALYSEQLEGDICSFAVGSDGISVELGQVFKVSDPNEAGERLGGRIHSATASVVELDAPVQLHAGELYTLSVLQPDPAAPTKLLSETRTVTTSAGTRQQLTVLPAFSAVPTPGTVYILESNAVAATTWRCISIDEVDGRNQYRITGVAHNPSKYGFIEQGLQLDQRPISRLRSDVLPPTLLTLSEQVYMDGAQPRIRVTASWRPPSRGLRYRLAWRLNLGAWQTLPDSEDQSVDIEGLVPGPIEVTVRSVNAIGSTSPPVAATLALGGKTTPPAAPSGVSVSIGSAGWVISVAQPPDADWSALEVRLDGANWAAAEVISRSRATTAVLRWLTAGAHSIRLRHWALERSSAEVVVALNVAAPAAPTITGVSSSGANVTVRFEDGATSQPVRTVRFKVGSPTDAWETATEAGSAGGGAGSHTVVFSSAFDSRVFVRSVDVAGNLGPMAVAVVTTTREGNGDATPPPAPTGVTLASRFGTNTLGWQAPTYTVGGGHSETIVYGALRAPGDPAPLFAAAKALGTSRTPAISFEHSPAPGGVWHYWLAHASKAAVVGALAGGTNGVSITTARLASADMDAGLLDATHFANNIEPVTMVTGVPGTRLTAVVFNLVDGKLYRWNGTAYERKTGVDELEGQLLGNQIADGAVTMPKIAARAVSAAQMVISDLTNLVPNGSLDTGDAAGWGALPADWVVQPKTASGSNAYINSPTPFLLRVAASAGASFAYAIPRQVECEAGDRFYLSLRAAITGGAGAYTANSFMAVVRWRWPDGSYVNAAYAFPTLSVGWSQRQEAIEAPSGAIGFTLYLQTTTANAGDIVCSQIVCRRMAQGKLIVDGDIQARHLDAGSVTAEKLDVDAVTAGKIAAGAISAREIAAKAITTDKLVVAGSQLIPNSDFQTQDLTNWRPWELPGNISVVSGVTGAPTPWVCQFTSAGVVAGQNVTMFSHAQAFSDANAATDGIEVNAGETYFVTLDAVRSPSGAGTAFDVRVFYRLANGTFNTSNHRRAEHAADVGRDLGSRGGLLHGACGRRAGAPLRALDRAHRWGHLVDEPALQQGLRRRADRRRRDHRGQTRRGPVERHQRGHRRGHRRGGAQCGQPDPVEPRRCWHPAAAVGWPAQRQCAGAGRGDGELRHPLDARCGDQRRRPGALPPLGGGQRTARGQRHLHAAVRHRRAEHRHGASARGGAAGQLPHARGGHRDLSELGDQPAGVRVLPGPGMVLRDFDADERRRDRHRGQQVRPDARAGVADLRLQPGREPRVVDAAVDHPASHAVRAGGGLRLLGHLERQPQRHRRLFARWRYCGVGPVPSLRRIGGPPGTPPATSVRTGRPPSELQLREWPPSAVRACIRPRPCYHRGGGPSLCAHPWSRPVAQPIIPWLGGKRRIADVLLHRFPAHSCYCEVFAGGAALFFLRPPAEVEVLNDVNGDLVNLYRVVQNHLEEFVRQFKWALSQPADLQVDSRDAASGPDRHPARRALLLPAAAGVRRARGGPELGHGHDGPADQSPTDRGEPERRPSPPGQCLHRAPGLGDLHGALRPASHALLPGPAVLADRGLWRPVRLGAVRVDGRAACQPEGEGDPQPERSPGHPAVLRSFRDGGSGDRLHRRRRE